jgi:hypothetical protein
VISCGRWLTHQSTATTWGHAVSLCKNVQMQRSTMTRKAKTTTTTERCCGYVALWLPDAYLGILAVLVCPTSTEHVWRYALYHYVDNVLHKVARD